MPHALADDPILQGLYASVAAMLVVFTFSFVLDNTSLYDPFWPLAPCALTVFYYNCLSCC